MLRRKFASAKRAMMVDGQDCFAWYRPLVTARDFNDSLVGGLGCVAGSPRLARASALEAKADPLSCDIMRRGSNSDWTTAADVAVAKALTWRLRRRCPRSQCGRSEEEQE